MKKILILIIFAVFIFGAWHIAYKYKVSVSANDGFEDVVFTIKSGEGVKKIAANLSEKDLIGSEFYFLLYVKDKKLEAGFQAGEYVLNKAMPITKVVSILTSGKAISRERTIKIIEGWRIDNIGEYLEKENISSKTRFAELAKSSLANWPFEFEKPKFTEALPASASLEGFLFPDTYRIFQDASEADIIEKMLKNFSFKLNPEIMDGIAESGRGLLEIVTMASMIEKEVRTYEDMRLVSGVFWNRIKIGQALESCATLAFILGVDKAQYTLADTKIDSIYNTYQNRGLPPGPICNPGLDAIRAAVFPAQTEYLYFLSGSDTGETVFSKTYDEHLRNKAKYLP